MSDNWTVHASAAALRATNPIRALVDTLDIKPNPAKSVLKLSLGDPTVFGNLPFPALLADSIVEAVTAGGGHAGYAPAHGTEAARAAVAKHWAGNGVTAEDVCFASGCSHALQIAFSALCDEGTNVLLPRPGFSVYQTICEFIGVSCKYYDLDPEQHWEINLESLKAACDDKTRAILVNNPSNPCGSVYSKEHLEALLAVAEERRLPIIADEIYANMAFGDRKFVSLASLSRNVPVLSCGGLAKQYLVPGWRVGWLVLHDRNDVLKNGQVYDGVRRIAQVLIGANTLVQAAVPRLLADTPAEFYRDTLVQLEANAKVAFEHLSAVAALKPIAPQGAMYMMVRIDIDALDIADDLKFCELLFKEESVFVLPGACFKSPNFFRVVICPPKEQLQEACGRIGDFCKRHTK